MVETEYLLKLVDTFYKNDYRYYHTIHHVKKMFQMLEQYQELFDEEFKGNDEYNIDLVKYAIAYHDAYYIPGFQGNEYMSAKLAEFDLNNKLDSADKIIVISLIESTDISYQCLKHSTCNIKILHDLDWSRFINYDEIIDDDLKVFNEAFDTFHCQSKYHKIIVENQKEFYQKYCNRDIFYTNTFSKYNKIAKENMKKRLEYFKEYIKKEF